MISRIAADAGLDPVFVKNTIQLFEQGCTIPFISRYRKEMTGGMDEVQIAQVQMLKNKYEIIARRKETMYDVIEQALI
jgi:uncharacterized protein